MVQDFWILLTLIHNYLQNTQQGNTLLGVALFYYCNSAHKKEVCMKTIIYTKLSKNKGYPRLFIEGQRLLSSGIKPGQRYSVQYANDQVIIQFSDDGERYISKRTRRGRELPVIDINNKSLQVLASSGRVRIVVKRDHITVTVHHHDRKSQARTQRLFSILNSGMPLEMVSLAHGAGIMDHALHQGLVDVGIPVRLAAAIEVEERYIEASLANNSVWDDQSVAIHAPMQEVELDEIGECDLLCAGLPCTGASLAGRAKNKLSTAEEHSTAGALFFTLINAVNVLNPSVIILENVPAYQTTASMTVIRSVLHTLGYTVHETVLNGNDLGAIENRDRFVMVGVTQVLEGFNAGKIQSVRSKEASINEILSDVPADSDLWKAYQYLHDKAQKDAAAGKGFKRQLLNGSEESCGTIGRGYKKARSTEPFLVQPDTGLQRLFTAEEHARIKTIPEHLINGLSETVAHEVLGQSVIYSAFVALGRLIGNTIGNLACLQDDQVLK